MFAETTETTTPKRKSRPRRGPLAHDGYCRKQQIIGTREIEGPIPIGPSKFAELVRDGFFPEPVALSPTLKLWRVEHVWRVIDEGLHLLTKRHWWLEGDPVAPRPEATE